MGQFISKPVKPEICDAVRFDTSTEIADFAFAEIEAFVGEARAQRVTPLGTDGFSIYHDGIQRWLELKPGQYVMKTDSGFFYPVDAGVFEHTFQPIVDGQVYSIDVAVKLDENGRGHVVEQPEAKATEEQAPAAPAAAPKKPASTRKRKVVDEAEAAGTLL